VGGDTTASTDSGLYCGAQTVSTINPEEDRMGYSISVLHRRRVIALLIFSVSVGAALAQNVEGGNQQLQTFKEGLASHGLTDFSAPSLIAALSHSDPQVRTMAAMKLAEDHPGEAAPAIESALSREQDLNAQIGLSQALWALHDDHGIAHLHAMCKDSSLSFTTLISVVDALGLTHSPVGICAETFFTAMGRSKESGEIAMGESRLAIIYCDSTPEQARRILITLRQYLADRKQEAQIRLEASQALADIGTPECAAAIREAISQEQNPDCRMFFAATLKGLERNPHRCGGNR